MVDKLELTWPGKYGGNSLVRDEQTGKPYQVPHSQIQPRLFIKEATYGDPCDENMLISGENLFALKTLKESGCAGKVKLIYIDPPYNTGNAFNHYDDGMEHSTWLTMMYDRLDLLSDLLKPEGSIWVQLDDNEAHYCRVLMDQVFGRNNFVANVLWQKIFSPNNSAKHFSANHDHILIYAKNANLWRRNLLPRTEANDSSYSNPDQDPRGPWASSDLSARNYYGSGTYSVTAPSGRIIPGPPKGRYWTISKESFERLDAEKRIWWGQDGNNMPRLKRFLSEVQEGLVPQTIWFHQDVGNTQEAKKEIIALFPEESEVFATAKPERLMRRIIEIGSDEGDLVLDCFLGTGTTAAVAHKMNRRWIGIEAGKHAETLCLARLQKVIDGTDQGGISKIVPPHPTRAKGKKDLFGEQPPPLGWTGGGGFHFYKLGKALLEKDAEFGLWRLNYTDGQLIEAICLHEGFQLYANGDRHGIKGKHYAHITEQFVTQGLVNALAAELAEDEFFTIYCLKMAYDLQLPDSIEIKRIPQALSKEAEQ